MIKIRWVESPVIILRSAVFLMILFLVAGLSQPSFAFTKDQSKLPLTGDVQTAQQAPPSGGANAAPPAPGQPTDQDQASPNAGNSSAGEDSGGQDETSLGEIPVITTIELTEDIARRAIDAYALVKDKYTEANLEEFENLQDFVDQAPEGKSFEADIKTFGFANVTEWNTAITAVGFAVSALSDDQSQEIRLQIDEIKRDNSVAQDMKDRMISSLTAMIPSENNKKVVQKLAADPAYEDKLRLLSEEE